MSDALTTWPDPPEIPKGKITKQQLTELLQVRFIEVVQPDGSVKKFVGGFDPIAVINALKNRQR